LFRVRNHVLGAGRDLPGSTDYSLIVPVAGQRDQKCRRRRAANRKQNHFTVELVVMLLHEIHPFPAGRMTTLGLLLSAHNRSPSLYPDVRGYPNGDPSRCALVWARRYFRVAPDRGRPCRSPDQGNGMQGRFARLVVPVAGSEMDDRVLIMLPDLLSSEGGTITFLFVVEVPQSMPLDAELPTDIDTGEQALRHAENVIRRALPSRNTNIVTELLQARAVGAAIVDEAIERDADAIVMSAAVHRRHGRPTLSETAVHVLLNAPCEVVVIRTVPAPLPASGMPR
jgi:nucleotide-binding universal stress UspA family protein